MVALKVLQRGMTTKGSHDDSLQLAPEDFFLLDGDVCEEGKRMSEHSRNGRS